MPRLLLLTALALGGCQIFGPDGGAAADVVYLDDPTRIEAPDTVAAGDAFEAVVWTVGGSSTCTRLARTDAARRGAAVLVRAYNAYPPADANWACTRDLRPIPHPVVLAAAEPGALTVRAVGRERVVERVVVVL